MKKIRYTLGRLIVGVAAVSLCGCASIISSGDRTIPITSKPDSAKVTVYDKDKIVVASGTTPARIKLKKGAGYFKGADYMLVLEKEGYQKVELRITHKLNGWYFGNFFLGGFLGLIVIDPITGAMWTLDPERVNVDLTASTACLDQEKMAVLTLDQLSPQQRQQMHPLVRN